MKLLRSFVFLGLTWLAIVFNGCSQAEQAVPPVGETPQSTAISALAFSPDGKTLVSGGNNQSLKFWEAATGKLLRRLPHKDPTALAFSPDRSTLASGDYSGTIKIWDVAGGRELRMLAGHTTLIHSLAFSPDSKLLVSGSDDGSMRIWDLAGSNSRSLAGAESRILAVAFSTDGKVVASIDNDGAIKLWNATSGRPIDAVREPIRFNSPEFSRDGKVGVAKDDRVELWDLAKHSKLRTITLPAGAKLSYAAFSPDGTMLASAWEVLDLEKYRGVTTIAEQIKAMESGITKDVIKLTDTASGRDLRTIPWGSPQPGMFRINFITFSPDGKTLAAGGDEGFIKLWDIASGRQFRMLHAEIER